MAIDGRSEVDGVTTLFAQGLQMIKPATTAARTIMAGRRARFKLKDTVISLEVSGFLSGAFLSVVGMPCSICASSERIFSAL